MIPPAPAAARIPVTAPVLVLARAVLALAVLALAVSRVRAAGPDVAGLRGGPGPADRLAAACGTGELVTAAAMAAAATAAPLVIASRATARTAGLARAA